MKTIMRCLECRMPISWGVHEFSQGIYGHSLCMKDQFLLEESGASAHIIDLYLALKQRNHPVVLEYFDGYKKVDMALPGKLYIEINGPHDLESFSVMPDLTSYIYSPEKNIPTIIIPYTSLENKKSFLRTVEELSKACRVILGHYSMLPSTLAVQHVQLQ
jgi:hypothetical protein